MFKVDSIFIKSFVAGFAALALAAPLVNADTRLFPKIADQNTPVPGGLSNFTAYTQPQVSGGNIVFAGSGTNDASGIYRFDPQANALSIVIDPNTALPGGEQLAGSVTGVGLSVYGPDVSFVAYAPDIPDRRLITTRGGLHIVTTNVSVPPFGPGTPTSTDAKGYAFGENYEVTLQTPVLMSGFASANNAGAVSLTPPSLPILHFITRDGQVGYSSNRRFVGTTGQYEFVAPGFGQIFSDGGGIPSQQQVGVLLPGQSSGYVFSASAPGSVGPLFSVDDNRNVAFRAAAVDLALQPLFSGIYVHPSGGQTQAVVTDSTIIPGFDGTTKFSSFSNLAIDGPVVAFIGAGGSTSGIFAASGGSLVEIISNGDTLDGRTVTSLNFSDDRPLSGNQLVFTAGFSDGSNGLFLAQVPEPSTIAVLVLTAVPLLSRRRP
jgi:hypothetical protein